LKTGLIQISLESTWLCHHH